eukprot:scaffold524846_cov17-Prasinocladus_malaysianus.AAC.1
MACASGRMAAEYCYFSSNSCEHISMFLRDEISNGNNALMWHLQTDALRYNISSNHATVLGCCAQTYFTANCLAKIVVLVRVRESIISIKQSFDASRDRHEYSVRIFIREKAKQ